MLLPTQSSGSRRERNIFGDNAIEIDAISRVVPAARALGGTLSGAGRLGFDCSPFGCVCSGDADCNDMFSTNACGPYAVCTPTFCWCSR